MSNDNDTQPDTGDESERYPLKRRTMLASTAGVATALAGFGAFTGTVAAWDRFEVDFKGCSEVWMIVDEDDLEFDPPTVAHVIVETDDGTDCRLVEFTEEAATTIPGQYGDAPLVKYAPDDGGKILAVLEYSRNEGGRFDRPSCLVVNDHRCAQTPNTADLYEADCVQAAYDGHWDGSYWDSGDCADKVVGREGPPKGRGSSGGGRGSSDKGRGSSKNGRGPPDDRGGPNRGRSRGRSRGPPK